MQIESSSAIVLGGASGLGEATVRALHTRGAHVTIAEKSSGAAVRQSLREESIARLLGSCRVGASCKVTGSVLNLSHDVFVYVTIDSISAK